MANQVVVDDKGFTVLHEALNPTVDVVFVHGFTGHPKDTWTSKKAEGQSTKRAEKHSRDDEPADTARRSKIPRLPFGRNPPTASTSASPVSQSSQTQMTGGTNGSNIAELAGKRRKDVYWPVDLACITIPDSRILTYGYDANVRHWLKGEVSKKTIYDHALDLLCSLEALRRNPNEESRPILFVAHSLGGIVVKEALARSKGCASTKAHLHGIFKATVGALFFGTPHRGADPRNFLHHLLSASAQVMGARVNDQIVSALMPNNERLTKLMDEFFAMCRERKWQVYSFQEEYGVRWFLGKKVVGDESSCLNDPAIETKQHISSNHMDMCRFSGLQDPEYLKVAAAITFILRTIKNGTDTISSKQPLVCRQPQDILFTTESRSISYNPSMAQEQPRDMPSLPETQKRRGEPMTRTSYSINTTIRQSLIDQLYFTKIDERLTSLTAAQGTTCRWFLTKPEYASWRDMTRQSDHDGFLWIKGNPGTGKSTLMKFLFEETKLSSKGDSSKITLSFFFLARGTVEEKSTTGLYRSLLHQLFEKAADLRDSLEWMTPDGARGIEQNGWHEEALKQTLMHAIRNLGSRSLTIFVDALDECREKQATDMICFFEELCDRARGMQARLQICFSSRHYPTVVIHKGIEVVLEREIGHTEDIREYIKSKLRLGKSKQAETLRSDILEKSSGIFLWVVLVIGIFNVEYPNSSVSIKGIRRRLKEVPPELNDLFEMILTRDGKNLERLQICLMCILFATRPLKPQELYFAVELGLDKDSSSCWDKEDIKINQMEIFVSSSSKGLAEVTRNKASEIQFIHETVRDFLLGKYGTRRSEASGNFVARGHETLRDSCLAQLNTHIDLPDTLPQASNAAQLRETISSKFPFLQYAVLNVLRHSNSAQQDGMQQGGFLARFPLRQWVILNNALERYDARRYTESVSLLYILAEKNLANLIQIHPERALCFDFGFERYGPPIFAALATGSHEAAQALVSARIKQLDSSLRDLCERQLHQHRNRWAKFGRGFTFSPRRGILSHLAEQGDAIVTHVFLLTSSGINIDAKDKDGRTPLFLAMRNGHEAVVQMLLATGQVDIEGKDNHDRTPFSWAAGNGHEAVIQQLLATGRVNIDVKDNMGRTPLLWAALKGRQGTVQQLLATGRVDINTKDNRGQTPLSWAAEMGREAVVQQLLATGRVNIDVKDSMGRTPFLWATLKGHEAIVQQLLTTGQVDVNVKDEHGWTPLSLAWLARGKIRQLLPIHANTNMSAGHR